MKNRFQFKTNITVLSASALSISMTCFSQNVFAQSLDDAVTDQLRTLDGIPCLVLLETDDPFEVLEGELLTICTRAAGQGDTPTAASSGGGAGTPTMLPSVVKRRLEESDDEEESESTETIWEFGRWSVFVSGEYEKLDRDVTFFEDGYESDLQRLTVGTDVQLTERGLLGIAIVGSDQNGDFEGGGDFSVDTLGFLAYGSFFPTDNSFIQLSAGYFDKSNDRTRVTTFESDDVTPISVTGTPDADFDADEISLGLLAGYDFVINNVTIGPRIGMDWVNTDFDDYSEVGDSGLELTFYNDSVSSRQSTLGVQGAAAFSTSYGVVSLQAGLALKHEFEKDQREEKVSFVGDTRAKRFTYQTEEPDRDFSELNLGVVFMLPHDFQLYGNYRKMFGHSYFDNYAGTIGLRLDL